MDQGAFERQFGDEAFELVVRIVWCWTNKRASFPQEGGLCHARARFDLAVDRRTDEVVGRGRNNWLEWLTPRHRIGHPYGLAFREGHLYRLLVREAQPSEGWPVECRYLVVRLLESDASEPRLDPVLQFEQDYCDEEHERTLLVEGGPTGWGIVFDYRRAAVRYLAWADGETDEPWAECGRLRWMERDGALAPRTRFDDLCVYRVRVREGRDDPSSLLLVKVVRKVRDTRFDAIREEYLRPVELASPLGSFVLDRRLNWYEGSIDYLGEPCSVQLGVEEGSTDATVSLARLEALCADLPALDQQVRGYAADELLESASDWCEEELAREEFVSRMGSPSICVDTDGSVELLFDDGGMFCGHVIVVSMEADGTLDSADIAG